MRNLSLLLLSAALSACAPDTLTIPTVVATPAPTPAPTPSPVAQAPAPAASPSVSFSAGACVNIFNNSDTPSTFGGWYTSFDDQTTQFDPRQGVAPPGESWGHCYNKPCIEVDADWVGVKPLGGYWFDVNMQPFNAHREPWKVDACRRPQVQPTPRPSPTPCVEDGPAWC